MKWKKWAATGLSGLAVGAVALVARNRRRKRLSEMPKPIPEDVGTVTIETDWLDLTYRDRPYVSRTVYTCNPTKFFVWSIFKSQKDAESESEPSLRIFHISPVLEFQSVEGEDLQSFVEEKFYATLHLRSERTKRTLPEHLARGDYLEFRKCHVGGSMNGVLTGDRILTTSPVALFEFIQAPSG